MDIPINEAGDALPDLVRRAEWGEDVVLTRDGAPAVRLAPVWASPAKPQLTPEEKRKIISDIVERAQQHLLPGPDAARSQDFLYDEDGLPAWRWWTAPPSWRS